MYMIKAMPALKKLVLSFLASLVLLTSFFPLLASNAYAQTSGSSTSTWYNQNFQDWYVRVYDSPPSDVFGERYTASQVQWIFYGMVSFVLNSVTGDPKMISCIMRGGSQIYQTLANAPVVGGIYQRVTPSGTQNAFGLTSCGIDKFFRNLGLTSYNQTSPSDVAAYILFTDRPLSGITYFKNVARNWHVIPEAKAQSTGFGFSALDPILPIWKVSRNTAYGVLVLAIVILSFMIMFRVKINPQTAISVQSAIPKVVVALILITFSYAIAGLIIDLMYVVIGFFSLIVSQAYQGLGVPNINFFGIAGTSPQNFFDYMTVGPSNGLVKSGIVGAFALYLPLFAVSMLIGFIGMLGALGTALLFPIVTIIIFIMFIVLTIIALFAMFKVFWVLLKAFVYIILLVIFAPLQIALGIVIPSLGFGAWLKAFISNLAVFPLAGVFFALAYLFLIIGNKVVLQSVFSGTPLESLGRLVVGGNFGTQAGWPPLLGGGGGATMGIVFLGVSLTMFLILPKVADMIQAVITGKPFAFGTAIGEAVGPIGALGALGLATQTTPVEAAAKAQGLSVWEYIQTLPPSERARYLGAAGLSRLFGGGRR